MPTPSKCVINEEMKNVRTRDEMERLIYNSSSSSSQLSVLRCASWRRWKEENSQTENLELGRELLLLSNGIDMWSSYVTHFLFSLWTRWKIEFLINTRRKKRNEQKNEKRRRKKKAMWKHLEHFIFIIAPTTLSVSWLWCMMRGRNGTCWKHNKFGI